MMTLMMALVMSTTIGTTAIRVFKCFIRASSSRLSPAPLSPNVELFISAPWLIKKVKRLCKCKCKCKGLVQEESGAHFNFAIFSPPSCQPHPNTNFLYQVIGILIWRCQKYRHLKTSNALVLKSGTKTQVKNGKFNN